MYNSAPNGRINSLLRILKNVNPVINDNLRAYISSDVVSIGQVAKVINETQHPEYVPRNYFTKDETDQSTLHHLRWMLQKDILGQDIFLIGPPGPRKRFLAMQFLELTNREHEYVPLSRDTTESDLKQRREIVKGTAKYFDQSAVRAAIEGRILLIDGIEKAERNVLPILNNLLENREMHLEDGRFLIPATRYDDLLQKHGEEELEKWKLVRVNENFRVIALGLPIPKYRGNPLDPPLRSRFQARDIHPKSYQEYYQLMQKNSSPATIRKIEQLLSCAFALSSKESQSLDLPDFPLDNLLYGAKILEKNPNLSVFNVLTNLYPFKIFSDNQTKYLKELFEKFDVHPLKNNRILNSLSKLINNKTPFIDNEYQNGVIEDMLNLYKVSDFCVVGPKGCGKNLLINQTCDILNKQTENIVLYQDMTSRDLIQQRATLDNGDTVWKFSPLIEAALCGKIAILDGIDRIHPSTLSVLHRLVHDRELQLYDGKRLINENNYNFLKNKYNLTDQYLKDNGILCIHPDFRIIAIGEPPNPNSSLGNWMSPEILSLLMFQEIRALTKNEEMHIIASKYGSVSKPLHKLIELAHVLRNNTDQSLKNLSGHLSTRQLLRIAARMANYPTDLYNIIQETFMIQFLPSLVKKTLEKTLQKLDIIQNKNYSNNSPIDYNIKDGILTIGCSSIKIYETKQSSKVPNVLFYDIPQHIHLMEKMLQDFTLGQHLLLVGNQGVGKNKIVDRFLQLLNRSREYIQLHRDTTIQTLTTQPTIRDGKLIHEDSPLVKAVKFGNILVIDEADKAPIHVTSILKTLIESGQMILSDGRKIIKEHNINHDNNENNGNIIKIHPDFRVIVLANRPGFPFLGNDFFGALGDLFSCHSVNNPTSDSEILLLKKYGPNVSYNTIKKLVDIFGDLRDMADQGLVSYPYSTREVVNIVKHINAFPEADLEDVIFNVFDFDRYSPEVLQVLGEVFEKHGFSSKNAITSEYIAAKRAKEKLQVTVERYSGLDTTAPKHGKEDPENEPHVGGNTWAGGTGGRDTAGLGGKGGPYRLDKGHKVHQLSDEEKNSVPEHIQRAAHEMGKKAFQERLKEIGMSPYDANLYNQFFNSVQRQINNLREILRNLQAKNKERYWARHRTAGELDDVKIIDGLLGEKNIYRKRTDQEPEIGAPQIKPKLFRVVVDVSGSMYRFNGYDGRLDRELEAVVLVMESFQGFEDKINYDIIGHSGESSNITFVKLEQPPKNNKEKLDIIRTMYAHSQFCWAGDHTLEATETAINSINTDNFDESIVIILSDANLQRYNISPTKLATILTSKSNISAYAIFIGSLGNQAEMLTQQLPAGRSFICDDVTKLPLILKQIFSSSIVSSSSSSSRL